MTGTAQAAQPAADLNHIPVLTLVNNQPRALSVDVAAPGQAARSKTGA